MGLRIRCIFKHTYFSRDETTTSKMTENDAPLALTLHFAHEKSKAGLAKQHHLASMAAISIASNNRNKTYSRLYGPLSAS